MGVLRTVVPARVRVVTRTVSAAVVGLTLYALGESARSAAAVAAGFLLLTLCMDAVEAVVGDYADNVVLGGVVLGFTVYVTATAWWTPLVVVGTAVGTWFVVDGVQHLRHGVTREEIVSTDGHDGGVLTGLLRAMGARLFEPFRL